MSHRNTGSLDMICILIWLTLITFMVFCTKAESGLDVRLSQNTEKRLLDYITREYDRNVRPVYNASHPVIIELGITLTQIFDMDEKNQVLTTNVWLDQEWNDEMLTWDPDEFDGLKEMRIPCEKIWLPDIVLYNNADDYTSGYMQSKAMVHSDGTVFWPPPTKFRSTCVVDVTYFPFDDQTCTMKLGSWTYNGYEVDVTNRSQDVDLSNYVDSGEWELLLATVHRNVVYYSCCPEPFPDVTISLTIRRKTLFYMYNIVLPCMMMSSLTLLVFCMPPESGEKIALGVTVLLAFSVFMLAIAEKMPETSDNIPLIGIYLTTVMAITCVSIIMTVVVLNLHYHDAANTGDTGRVPGWIKRFLNNRKSGNFRSYARHCMLHRPERKMMRFQSSLRRRGRSARTSTYKSCEAKTRPLFARRRLEKEEAIRMNTVEQPAITIERAIGMPDGPEHLGASCCDVTIRHCNTDAQCTAQSCIACAVCCQCQNMPLDGINGQNNWPHPQIIKPAHNCSACSERGMNHCYLGRMSVPPDNNLNDQDLERHNQVDPGGNISDWRRLAVTCDRILFWVFLVVTVATSLLFIVILPLYKRSHLPSRMSHLNKS